MLVEDDQIVLEVTASMLEALNYRVLTAQDGADGLAVYNDHAYQIALGLTDAMMPNMDGLALSSALQAKAPEVKVLLMSGYAGDSEMTSEIPHNIMTRLQKPLNVFDLARALEFDPASAFPALANLPLYEQSLSWVIPTAIVLVICLVVDYGKRLPAPEPGEPTASFGAEGARAASVHA